MRKPFASIAAIVAVCIVSGCKEEKSEAATPAAPSASTPSDTRQLLRADGKPIDASCFSLLLSDEEHPPGEGAPVALRNCRREDLRPLPGNDNLVDTTDYDYVYTGDALSPSGTDESGARVGGGADGHMKYKVLGTIGADTIVRYAENSGEDGAPGFESLLRVSVADNKIVLKSVPAAGGDRCAGGIREASVVDGVLRYALNLTPAGLLTLPIPGLPIDNAAGAEGSDDPDGVCPAIVEKRDDTVVKVRLNADSPAARRAFAETGRSSCFFEHFAAAAQKFPDGMTPVAFADFRRTLSDRCK